MAISPPGRKPHLPPTRYLLLNFFQALKGPKMALFERLLSGGERRSAPLPTPDKLV